VEEWTTWGLGRRETREKETEQVGAGDDSGSEGGEGAGIRVREGE